MGWYWFWMVYFFAGLSLVVLSECDDPFDSFVAFLLGPAVLMLFAIAILLSIFWDAIKIVPEPVDDCA